MLKLFHPEILIPLVDLSGSIRKNIILESVSLTFKKIPYFEVLINRKMADNIKTYSENTWNYQK